MNEEIKKLHEIIRKLIDIEMCFINNKHEEAYYLLGRFTMGKTEKLIKNLHDKTREKLISLQGDKC